MLLESASCTSGRRELGDELGQQDGLQVLDPCVSRTSASDRPIKASNPTRLHWSTAPVLPLTPTFPVLRTSNATMAVLMRFRSSCARKPRRSLPRADSLSIPNWLRSRPYSVTAPAMASSRHRLSVRNSSALIDAPVSTASSVIDWQTSP